MVPRVWSQSSGQDSTVSGSQINGHILKTLVAIKSKKFYTDSLGEYKFRLKTGEKETSILLTSSETPKFSYSDSVIIASGISEKDHTVNFSFPQFFGIDIFPMLPAIASFEIIEINSLRELKPSTNYFRSDSSCAQGVFSKTYGELEGDTFHICLYDTYEKETLKLFDSKGWLCYRNQTTLKTSSDEYRLVHWFEPEKYGFVKFLLIFPNGDEWSIDLISANP